MMQTILFYILAALAIAGALGVVLARNPVYAVLSLVATMFAISGIFVVLQAYFVAVIQILVYAGAVLVLFLFVVMLLDMAPETLFRLKGNTLKIGGTLFAGFILWEILMAAGLTGVVPGSNGPGTAQGTPAAVGQLLFTRFSLPFEVASLLLLVGIIGAIVLAKKKPS